MKLYHGTAKSRLAGILKEGIKPRGKSDGNWKHSVESNPDFVYLTNAYALYFAGNAVSDNDQLAVIEIDTDLLDTYKLAPDEDWLEQATRKLEQPGLAPIDKTMKYRTRWYRRRLKNTLGTGYWEYSLAGLGTCTHYGTVPVRAITRTAVVEPDTYMRLMLFGGLDPTISLMNYKIIGDKYRNTLQWLFDGVEPPEDKWAMLMTDKQRDQYKEVWSRQGIEVLNF